MANNVDHDQTPSFTASDLELHCWQIALDTYIGIHTVIHFLQDSKHFMGKEAQSSQGILAFKCPIAHRVVLIWRIWKQYLIIHSKLRADPSECFVFLTEPVLNPRANRETITQVMFKTSDDHGFLCLTQQLRHYWLQDGAQA